MKFRLKLNPIRLTLPLGNSTSSSISNESSTHRTKSIKVKEIRPEKCESSLLLLNEDNTNSIDDLPLGERTSPTKILLNNIQTNIDEQQTFSTPIKKKLNSNKKKSNLKKQNNIVGVAVIEERRVRHSSSINLTFLFISFHLDSS